MEYLLASVANVVTPSSPAFNSSRTMLALSSVGSNICRAVALIVSGASPYTSFENALLSQSNAPIDKVVGVL